MERCVALDAPLEEISVRVAEGEGAVVFEGEVAAEPAALANLIRAKAPRAARVGLGTGATSPRLHRAIKAARPPVAPMDARRDARRSRRGRSSPAAATPVVWPTCCAWAGTAR